MDLRKNSFEMDRYVGMWYEISKVPNSFEKACHFATAEYSWNPIRKIMNIKNTCLDKQRNVLYSRSGEAKIINKAQRRLKVTFTDGLSSDTSSDLSKNSNSNWNYRILYTDYDNFSIVTGGSDSDYLWILSRTPQISAEDAITLLNRIKSFGFDEKKLISKPSLIYR